MVGALETSAPPENCTNKTNKCTPYTRLWLAP